VSSVGFRTIGMEPRTPAEAPPAGLACRNHPDRQGRYVCEKLGQRFCKECARCPRPTHCKFRTQCLIRETETGER